MHIDLENIVFKLVLKSIMNSEVHGYILAINLFP
jgi:hypothetical protein